MSRVQKIKKAIDFIDYISKTITKEDMMLEYRLNGVTPEKTALYLDFIYGLFDLVTTTYLGDDVMSEQDIDNHFNWCWDKNLDNFRKEGMFFTKREELYTYFYTLFIESFYSENDKSDEFIGELISFWDELFNYNRGKTMSEIESFIDLYKIFNNSLYV